MDQQHDIAAIRQALMSDGDLRQQFGAIAHKQEAAHWLGERFATPAAGDLAAALEPEQRRPGMAAPDLVLAKAPPPDFLPVAIILLDEQLAVEWLWLGSDGLQEPFYYRSTERADQLPINALLRCVTPLAALEAFAQEPPPAGLIYHMSRCGSTLVSQMLAASPDHVVISEAPFMDNMVQLASFGAVPENTVHAAAAALLRQREGRRGFIKLDPLHSLALPMLQRIFPDVPWIFLFRDPAEVLVSHSRLPGLHVQQGHHPLDSLGIRNGDRIDPAAYPAWVTEHICRGTLKGAGDPNGLYLDYTQLPEAVATSVLPHFGIAPDQAMLAAIEAVSQRDAKAPDKPFVDDTEAKREEARETISVPDSLQQAYASLEQAAAGTYNGDGPASGAPSSTVSITFDW